MSHSPRTALAILERAVARGEIPGWALAAGWGAETELVTVGGHAELAPHPRPMREHTRFDIASLTKVVATLPIVLRLIARGELELATRVVDVLPAFSEPTITVEALLTHTAGLPPSPDPTLLTAPPATLTRAILATPPLAPPNHAVVYSDVGFLVLGWLAEAVTGRPLDALLAAEVTDPLGLTATRYGPLPEPHDDVAATEPRHGHVVCGTVHDETAAALDAPAGHAGLFSDVTDLGVYLGAWTAPGDGWLPLELRSAATTDRTAHLDGHRGLGWTARHDRFDQLGDGWPPTAIFHSGFTGTSLALDPDSGRWVVLLTNRVHLGRDHGAIAPLRRAVHAELAPR